MPFKLYTRNSLILRLLRSFELWLWPSDGISALTPRTSLEMYWMAIDGLYKPLVLCVFYYCFTQPTFCVIIHTSHCTGQRGCVLPVIPYSRTLKAEEPPTALLLSHAAFLSVKKNAKRRASLWYLSAADRLDKIGIVSSLEQQQKKN